MQTLLEAILANDDAAAVAAIEAGADAHATDAEGNPALLLAAYRGLPGSSGYCATKAGLSALLEALRPELKPRGITVTTVHPGFVRTPMTAGQRHPQPFLMDVEPAARIIVRGIEARRRRIDFPMPMVALMTMVRLMPGSVYDRVIGRFALRQRGR